MPVAIALVFIYKIKSYLLVRKGNIQTAGLVYGLQHYLDQVK